MNRLFSYRVMCDTEEKKLDSTQYPTNTKINPIDIDERIYLTKPVKVPRLLECDCLGPHGEYNDDGSLLESNDPGAIS